MIASGNHLRLRTGPTDIAFALIPAYREEVRTHCDLVKPRSAQLALEQGHAGNGECGVAALVAFVATGAR